MMDAKKSKFDFGSFYNGYHHFAVNAGKYTKEQAIEIHQQECYCKPTRPYIVEKSHVKWRAGQNEDHEPCVGWWFDYSPTEKRSVEVWAFRPDFDKKRAELLAGEK